MINLLFTVEPIVARRALTEVSSFRVVTAVSTVEAGAVGASRGAQLAVSSIETRRTRAAVGVFEIL